MATEFPLLNPDYIDNPAPYWRGLREQAPLYWSDDFKFWVVTKYEDVETIAKSPKDFSSAIGPAGGMRSGIDGGSQDSVGFLPMIQNDPPEHTRLRSLLAKSFTPRRIESLEDAVSGIAEDLTAKLKGKAARGEPMDLYKDFASPLPVAVIAQLLGIPMEFYEQLKFWNEAMGIGSGRGYSGAQRFGATNDMTNMLKEIIEEKRSAPKDDLISSLVQIADDVGGKLKASELLGFCKLLWIAGNETTTNLISNASIILQERPDILKRLRDDKSLIPAFIEEALRYASPVNGLFRCAMRDLEYKGVKVRKGDSLWLLFASANRDADRFERPDEFILERSPNDHLAFGAGIHFCMGSALARMEARLAFEHLVDVLPGLRLRPDEGLRIPTPVLRGWVKLPMQRA